MIKLYCDVCEKPITEKRKNIFSNSGSYCIPAHKLIGQSIEFTQWTGDDYILCKSCLIISIKDWLMENKDEVGI